MELQEEFQQLLVNRFSGEDTALILDMFRIASKDYTFTKPETAISTEVGDDSEELIKQFMVAKVIEGLAKRSIDYYKGRLLFFVSRVQVPLRNITSDHIKAYLAQRKIVDKLQATTQNNEIRVLRSFFSWALDNDYISKNPTLKIKSVKEEKKVKKPFTEIELEQLRAKATDKRNPLKWSAIIEVLASTGCRVSELIAIDRDDIDGERIIVRGKGNKDRYVYLNARAILAVNNWLNSRTDDYPAFIIGESLAGNISERMTAGAIESGIRKMGRQLGIEKCHPHRFRRTTATLALNRGMPIEQVSKMLGHEQLTTTQIYAQASENNLASSHKKFVT